MKRFYRLRANKGFTLAELLVSVGIMAMLMLMLMTLFTPINRMVSEARQDTRMDGVLENIGNYIRRSVDITQRLEAYKLNDPAKKLEICTVMKDFATDDNFEVYALYLDGNGRLFDLGLLDDATINPPSLIPGASVDILKTRIANGGDEVFFEPYYNNCILRHRISVLSSGGLQIRSIAYRDGEALTGDRVTSFNILSPNLQIKLDTGADDNINNYDDEGILILYNLLVRP